jgi:hypothetical protein
MQTNVLNYGDNLDILRRYLPDSAIDLAYLDPPSATDALLLTFEDTWHWGPPAEATYGAPENSQRADAQELSGLAA